VTAALIGRRHPVEALRAEITRTADSHGGLVLVTGEAGIGKTTLVGAAAEEARRRGALVLGGSCWDSDSAPGFWPWVQVVRALWRGVPPAEWATIAQVAGSGLGVLLGESPGPGPGGPPRAEPDRDRADAFALYDAVTSALVAASQRRPVVVALDDLHWADAASLRLLEFAAQHT
jgi:predicted ATPase